MSKRTPAAKAGAQAPAASAEQQGNLPAGTTSTAASAAVAAAPGSTDAAGSTEQTIQAPEAAAATSAVDEGAGSTGLESGAVTEPPKTVMVLGGGSPLSLVGSLSASGEYVVTLPTPQHADTLVGRLTELDLLDEGEVEGLFIRAVPEAGFRRCGMSFTREGHGIALSALTEEEVGILVNEPNLTVERGVFSGLVE